jgi:CRISPR-associated protein Csb3
MGYASVPVDLTNFGHVFGCLGLLEATEILLGGAEGAFDWSAYPATFALRTDGHDHPVRAVLEFLQQAQLCCVSPGDSWTDRDVTDCPRMVTRDVSWAEKPDPANMPMALRGATRTGSALISLSYWADNTGRFHTRFQKATNGNSVYRRLNNAFSVMPTIDLQRATAAPFDYEARTETLFRLDPRGSVDPLDAGFSPDNLRKGRKGGLAVRVTTYPLCELLAAIGLEHARPREVTSTELEYSVWAEPLPVVLARAVVGCGLDVPSAKHFRVEHVASKQGGNRNLGYAEEASAG